MGAEGTGEADGFAEAGAGDWGVSFFAGLASGSGLGSLFEGFPRPPPRPPRPPPRPLPLPGRLRPLNALGVSPDLVHLGFEPEGPPEGTAAGVAIEDCCKIKVEWLRERGEEDFTFNDCVPDVI